MIDTAPPWLSSKIAGNKSDDSIVWRPAAARLVEGQLEDEFRGRRDTQLAASRCRQHLQVLLERLQNLVGVQLEIAHYLRERVPLHLREREENVFVGQQRVITSPWLLPSRDPLRAALTHQSCLCDVEVFHRVAAS